VPNYVALLRGVNVGGNNLLPVKDMARLFTEAGCANVRTYIQSGNVIFRAPRAQAERLPAQISKRIERQFGHRTPVLLRSGEELGETIRNNPFLQAGATENCLHVMFLATEPEAGRVLSLEPDRSPPDRFCVRGREIYVHCPNGAANTKLTNAWFDSRLATITTGRNWRTVLKLYELAQG
jgi:uncharacterized protein (DUF1697 family)